MFLHADSKDSNQTGQMPRLILVFAGCIGHFIGFVVRQLIFCFLFIVYNAVGLAAFDLFDDINFDVWFPSHLIQELQVKHVK